MNRVVLEKGMVELSRLVSDNSSVEAAFQRVFEQHAVLWEAMGYARSVPHPRLRRVGETDLIPDFVLQGRDGVAVIVDLKTPAERIVKRMDNRPCFFDPVNQYCGQLEEYIQWFDDSANRQSFAKQHGIEVPKEPTAAMIVGQSPPDDHRLVRELSRRRRYPIQIVTYSDALAAIRQTHSQAFLLAERSFGASLNFLVRFPRPGGPGRRILLELWSEKTRASLRCFLDTHGGPGIEVVAHNGEQFKLVAPTDIASIWDTSVATDWMHLAFEVADLHAGTEIGIFRDGEQLAAGSAPRRMAIRTLVESPNGIMGCTREKTEYGLFDLREVILIPFASGF